MKKPKNIPTYYQSAGTPIYRDTTALPFAVGGPLHDRDINGKLLQSTYASALGNMFREGGPFGEDQGTFDYATSIYASQPGNYYAQGGMINREYRTGGQFPRPYSLPEDSFKQGGTNLHNSVYASSSAPYPGIYAEGGTLLPPDNAPAGTPFNLANRNSWMGNYIMIPQGHNLSLPLSSLPGIGSQITSGAATANFKTVGDYVTAAENWERNQAGSPIAPGPVNINAVIPSTPPIPEVAKTNYYTDPYTGQVVKDFNPATGVATPREIPSSFGNTQYANYLEKVTNSPAAKENQQALEAERLNNMELLKTMTPEQKATMRAAGLTPAQYLADPFSAGANKFAEGGSILSMSNTPQLEGEGKDLTYPDGAYVYGRGGVIKSSQLFANGGPIYPTNQQLAQFLNPEYQRVTQGQEVTVRPTPYQLQQAKNNTEKYNALNIKPEVAESTKPNIAPVDKNITEKAIAQKAAERKIVAKEIKNSPMLTKEQKAEILMSPQKLDENIYLAYQKKPETLKAAKEYSTADKATNILRNPLVAASYFMKPGEFNMPMNYSELERSPNYSDETWNRNAVGQGVNFASYFTPVGLALHTADNALYTATDLDKALESGKTEDWRQAGLSAVNTGLDLIGSRYIGNSGRLLNTGERATLNAMNTSNRLGLNSGVNNYLGTRVFPNISSQVVRSADDIAAARLIPQINPNAVNYNPLSRNLYNQAVTAGNTQNALEAVQSNPFNIDELRRVYHNSERFLSPEESRFLSQQGRGEAVDYLSEANRARPSTISPEEAQNLWAGYNTLRESGFKPEKIIKNKSGLTKEEALEKVAVKDKDILSTMNSTDFENTVIKPNGEVVQYKPGPEVNQMMYDTDLKQMRLVDQVPMTSEEYATAFNERLDLLNDIIAQKNKSGVEYRVTGLTPYGNLEFYTPKQTVARQMSEKRTAEYNNYLLDPEKFITERAGLRQNNNGKWVFNDDIGSQRFNTKEEALNWAKADIEQLIGPEISEIEGTSNWSVDIKPGQWRGDVEDIANAAYYKSIPGLNMSITSSGVFADSRPRKGSGAYESINEYLKQLDLGRVKPGFNSQTDFSRGAWENFIKSGRAYGYYANPSTVYGTMKKDGGPLNTPQQTRVVKSSQLFNR